MTSQFAANDEISGKERCDPIVTLRATSAALSVGDSASTPNVAPRPTAAAAVIRASCPPPTMPTAGMPVTDLRSIGAAGPANRTGPSAHSEPAGDNGEYTRCSLRGSPQYWVQPSWRHEAAASRHSRQPARHRLSGEPRQFRPVTLATPASREYV